MGDIILSALKIIDSYAYIFALYRVQLIAGTAADYARIS